MFENELLNLHQVNCDCVLEYFIFFVLLAGILDMISDSDICFIWSTLLRAHAPWLACPAVLGGPACLAVLLHYTTLHYTTLQHYSTASTNLLSVHYTLYTITVLWNIDNIIHICILFIEYTSNKSFLIKQLWIINIFVYQEFTVLYINFALVKG